MSGITGLDQLIDSLSPRMRDSEYAFCRAGDGEIADYASLEPLVIVKEDEGLTLILAAEVAKRNNLSYDGTFRCITLTVHSSLDSVGLTAVISSQLASHGIPANIVAGYYHDHVFVPTAMADSALALLNTLSRSDDQSADKWL